MAAFGKALGCDLQPCLTPRPRAAGSDWAALHGLPEGKAEGRLWSIEEGVEGARPEWALLSPGKGAFGRRMRAWEEGEEGRREKQGRVSLRLVRHYDARLKSNSLSVQKPDNVTKNALP